LVNTEKEEAVGLKAIEIELGFKLINEATAHDTSIITRGDNRAGRVSLTFWKKSGRINLYVVFLDR
jgi:hypothetical protein